MRIILSLFIWIGCALITVATFCAIVVVSVLFFPFDKQRRLAHAQGFWWSDAIIALNPFWTIHVSGLENIDYKKAYVITANHQSLADIIVLYKTRMQFKWMAKESLFKVPFLGWSMALVKYMSLERGDYASIKKNVKESSAWLRSNMSLLFFPEGTRSRTGKVKEFKNGAFKLAIKEKRPILPITIKGTMDIIPKGNWILTRKVAGEMKVHPAIDTTEFTMADLPRLKEIVYERIGGV